MKSLPPTRKKVLHLNLQAGLGVRFINSQHYPSLLQFVSGIGLLFWCRADLRGLLLLSHQFLLQCVNSPKPHSIAKLCKREPLEAAQRKPLQRKAMGR